MKRVIKSSLDDAFAMTMIRPEKMDVNRTGKVSVPIYISEEQASHGPRIKFYGGTKETAKSKDMPSYPFSSEGPGNRPILADWMDKQNCPNGFNATVLNELKNFITKLLPILYLCWFNIVNQDVCEDYIRGINSISEVLDNIVENLRFFEILDNSQIEKLIEEFKPVKTLEQLDSVCRKYQIIK